MPKDGKAALRRIRDDISAIPTTLSPDELNLQLQVHQRAAVRALAGVTPPPFPTWQAPAHEAEELLAWQRLLDIMEMIDPSLPRVGQAARGRIQLETGGFVYLTTPEGAVVWKSLTIRYIGALIELLPDPQLTASHPSTDLAQALNALHGEGFNANLFRTLADHRKTKREANLNRKNALAKLASESANAVMRAGGSSAEAMAELDRALSETADEAEDYAVPQNSPALRGVVGRWLHWCKRANQALAAGGARPLNSALAPNSLGQPRSIELDIKLNEAERICAASPLASKIPAS